MTFGIPGEQVDGMDVRMVREAAERAMKHAREGNGPYILEMQTYRYRGHSMSDPAKYRSKDEVQSMRAERDPIEQVKARILNNGWASEEELKALDKELRAVVSDAADFATEAPEPDVGELYTEITV
ncbi:MAG: pyruvate dehydrogenase E1 component alpha subunit [Maritalea sp.]